MEFLTNKEEISGTYESVREYSYQEKKSPLLKEGIINSFLDAILDFKSDLKKKTEIINEFNQHFEKVTWINAIDEECLRLLNDLISITKDLYSTLIRQYVMMDPLRQRGIAKNEIKDFKLAVDELRESFTDLESVFFFLPEMPDFVETTNELSLI